MLKKLSLGLVGLLVLLVAILAVNTVRKGSRQLMVSPIAVLPVDEAAVTSRLSEAIQLKTVATREDPTSNADQFKALHALMEKRFPKVHVTLKREIASDGSLLYVWQGSQADALPILMLAHQDVVPVPPETEKNWTYPAFGGVDKDGYIWGRGSLDNKGNLFSQLEAIEALIGAGFKPQRSVYLFASADEEIQGIRGAKVMAATLKARKVRFEFVIDEGLMITQGILPGVAAPVAIVGIAEKGYTTVLLKLSGTPGHASLPPPKGTATIALMSAALKRVDDEQAPAGIRGAAAEMFDTLAPEMGGVMRVALSNRWLFGPLVQKKLEQSAATNAMLRTTTALTVVHSGSKDNVLPGTAEANINFRLLPGDTIDAVLERTRALVGKEVPADRFEIYALDGATNPSPIAPTDGPAYHVLNKTLREVFPDALVVPGLYIAGSDSVHFTELSDHIYKFSPWRLGAADTSRIHGIDERVAKTNYVEAIRFYHRLITESSRVN